MIEALRRSGATVEVEQQEEEDCARGRVTTPHGERRELCLETTTKGNGCLWIGNLMIRVLDTHDDGVVYQPECLGVRFVDVDADQIDDIVVEGNAVQTESPYATVPVRGVFTFDAAHDQFRITSLAGPVTFAWQSP